MVISSSDYVWLSQNLSCVTKVYSREVRGREAWLTSVTWEPTTDTAREEEQGIQEMVKPERLPKKIKNGIGVSEVTAKLLCSTYQFSTQMRIGSKVQLHP